MTGGLDCCVTESPSEPPGVTNYLINFPTDNPSQILTMKCDSRVKSPGQASSLLGMARKNHFFRFIFNFTL